MRSLLRWTLGLMLAGTASLLLSGTTPAQEKGKKDTKAATIKVGEKAPAFESIDDQGKAWKSKDVVGKKILVVYFYPADLTGGCTKQACGFRDDIEKLGSKGVEVVGVSGDSADNHKLFKSVHKLNFTLLADEKGEVAKKFGVPVNKGGTFKYKGDDGKVSELVRGVTIARWTIVIDKAGNVAAIDNVADAAGDPKRIAAIVKNLESK